MRGKLFFLVSVFLAVVLAGGVSNGALIAYYNFGTGSPSTANQGTAGSAADGVLINGAQIVDIDTTAGGVEWALQLNNMTGSSLADCQYMNITNGDDNWYDTAVPGGYSPVTFAAWVRMDTDTTRNWRTILSKGYETALCLATGTPVSSGIDQVSFSYHKRISALAPLYGTVGTMSDEYWSHVVAVMGEGGGSVCGLYINGVLQESQTTWISMLTNDLDLLIGAEPNRTDCQYGWNGMLDDVRIYDEFIDAQGVMDLFNDTYSAARPTIPDPATILLLGLGGLALYGRRRRT